MACMHTPLGCLDHGPVSLPPDQSHALVGPLRPLAQPVSERRGEAAAPPLAATTAQARETGRRELAHLCTRVPSVRRGLARVILPATAAADHIECYPGEQYEKTTQLEGVSMDVFVTKKWVKEPEKHGNFEIYYVKKK
jgi:hypothetical protein